MTFISLKCKSRTKPVTVVYLSTFDGNCYSIRISPLFWPARDRNIWYFQSCNKCVVEKS